MSDDQIKSEDVAAERLRQQADEFVSTKGKFDREGSRLERMRGVQSFLRNAPRPTANRKGSQ